MLSIFKKALVASVAIVGLASVSQAVTVTYILSLNDNGQGVYTSGKYAVYVTDSTGDNYGLASYGVDLTNIGTSPNSTCSNVAPKITYSDSSGTNADAPAGFQSLRSAANASTLGGSQDTIDGGVDIIMGFGQTAGNLSSSASIPAGYDGSYGATDPTYAAKLLLATGTMNTNIPGFGLDFGATVFTANTPGIVDPSTLSIYQLSSSEVVRTTQNLAPVPEPASLGVLALGALALLARRRKVA